MAKEPDAGITTHPEVMRAVIKILKDIGCKIYVGDGPSVWCKQIENVEVVYERTGIRRVCEEESVELVTFDKRRWRKKFPLTTWLDDCDYLVSVPKFKTHDLTLLTGAIKNLFGLVCGTYKTELHKNYFTIEDFAAILVDIYEEARPALTVVDGIIAMEGDGPAASGILRQAGVLIAGSDGVAVDSVLALLMGLSPLDVPTTRSAARRGLGVADDAAIRILGEKLKDVTGEPFQLPVTSLKKKILPIFSGMAKKLVKHHPYAVHENCVRCVGCIQICPQKAISMRKNRIVFNYRRCISCFCCQETCPHGAIKVKKSLVAKMIGL
jgi:uncharacterized protein (DUF362 family)/Pyruvate/2-oxoacid:ferredoxin oxidoreductase delta subunit